MHGRFWRRLIRERAHEFAANTERLRKLRYEPEKAADSQKRFGKAWREMNTNVYKLIAGAYGESWDLEDEEKHGTFEAPKKEAAVKQRENDNLARAREKDARVRFDQLQREPQAGLEILEEGRRRQGQSAQAQGQSRQGGGRREGWCSGRSR